MKYAIGFFLTMAMAILRFSDMDRAKDMGLNDDALYGTTWRSKSKAEGMPWAMPRKAWNGVDFGKDHFQHIQEIFQEKQGRDWH